MPVTDEVDYGYGDAAPSSSNRGRSNLKEDHKSRDRSRSASRGRSVGRHKSMKTPSGGGKKYAVMDPLAVSATASKLNNLFNTSGGGSGNLEPDDQSAAEDAAMMFPESTKIEADEPHENSRHQRQKEGRSRTERKTRTHQRSRKQESEKSEKPKHRHRRTSKSPTHHRHRTADKSSGDINEILKSPTRSPHGSSSKLLRSPRSPHRSNSDKTPHRHHHHHHHSSTKRDKERGRTKKSSSDTKLHQGKTIESKQKLRAPSLSPKTKKKCLRRKPSDSSGVAGSDDTDNSSSSSDSDDSSNSSSSSASDGNTVMQFDPLASGGTVEVDQKERKDGISDFSDPVGDAQRLQCQSKKPVFSFLDSDCSDDDDDDDRGGKKGAKKGGAGRSSHGKKQASGRPKISSAASSRRNKNPEKVKKKAKEKEKEKEKPKTEETTYASTMLSMSGFNSSTCHFCHKDVGPMIMQCMSCKETYFCQKCMRKGLVAPHQQECAQRKVDEREQRSSEARRRGVKAHNSMPVLRKETPAPTEKEKKRRQPKKSDSAPLDPQTFTKDSQSLFHKKPLMGEVSDPLPVHQEEVDDMDESPTKSPGRKLGIGKFFGGLVKGKKKKNGGDDDNNNDDGSGDDDDDASVSSMARKVFRRPSMADRHQLMDDDSYSSL